MQKKVMALAVAGVLAAPVAAFAQANYEIYGRANLGLDQYKAEDAAVTAANPNGDGLKARMRVFDSGSRVGFRGAEDLGGGLKAIFQIESGVNIDNGSTTGQGGQPNASAGTWASRDSFVGIDGGFGRVTFGRQSIFWANGAVNQFAANYVNTEVPWANGTGLGTWAGVARTSNVMAYTTPTVSGINGTLSYSPNAAEAQQVGAQTDGKIVGLTARYTGNPVVAQVDWVDNKDNSTGGPISTQRDRKQWKAGAGFAYTPGALVSLIITQGKDDNPAATAASGNQHRKQSAWTLSWEHTFGSIQALAMYGKMNKMETDLGKLDGSDATAYMVGARYFLSKRTWTYLTFNQVKNGNGGVNGVGAATADYTGAGITSANPTMPAGADPRVIAVGIFHNF